MEKWVSKEAQSLIRKILFDMESGLNPKILTIMLERLYLQGMKDEFKRYSATLSATLRSR